MIWNLSDYYIRIHYIYSIEDQIDVGDIYGFPYCVLLYSIAFLANVIVFILCVGDVGEHRRQTSQDVLSQQAGPTTTKTVVWSPSHYTVP